MVYVMHMEFAICLMLHTVAASHLICKFDLPFILEKTLFFDGTQNLVYMQ